jgi:hypothetical protein
MSKFIITNKKLLKNEVIEVETPEESLSLLTNKTIQIVEEYPNGIAVIHRCDLEDMITQKKANEEYEAEQLKIKSEEK